MAVADPVGDRSPREPVDGTGDRQRQYYNEIAETYDRHYHNKYALAYRTRIYDELTGDLDLRERRVLDAMCGGGENTSYFLGRGALVQGQDISEEQCRIYARRHPGLRVDCSSILDSGYPDDTFDLVVAESLHHLPPQLDAGVREIVRILKPGGHLLLWEPSAGSALDLVRKVWYRLDRKYFLENERSIDLREVLEAGGGRLQLSRSRYGGNVGFILVFSSMHLRIPPRWLDVYAPACLAVERWINKAQGKLFSSWVAALLSKRPAGQAAER